MVLVYNVGFNNFKRWQVTAGSGTALIVSGAMPMERVEITHLVGSPAFVRIADNTVLTPYNTNTVSGTDVMLSSGNTLNVPVHMAALQFIGSAGSPIGASTSTLQINTYW